MLKAKPEISHANIGCECSAQVIRSCIAGDSAEPGIVCRDRHSVLLVLSPPLLLSQVSLPGGDPANFESLARQATAARDQGKPEEAIRYYQQALQIHPDWQEGWWYVGTLLYDSNHFADAIPAFAKVVELIRSWDRRGAFGVSAPSRRGTIRQRSRILRRDTNSGQPKCRRLPKLLITILRCY